MTNENPVLYTVGHSVHDFQDFLRILKINNIKAVCDVRSSPYSKFTPQFNREALEKNLKTNLIYYVFLGKELGARRDESECYINNKVNYKLVSETPEFKRGIARLVDGASKMNVAIMCAEKDPLTCHRTVLVAHYARSQFSKILHILEDGKIETGDQADDRLLLEYKLVNEDLFTPKDERIKIAYEKRAEKIAYEENEREINYG